MKISTMRLYSCPLFRAPFDRAVDHLFYQVDLNSTVLALKRKIADQAGVVPDLQRLIYKGRVLKEDGQTLASYSESLCDLLCP